MTDKETKGTPGPWWTDEIHDPGRRADLIQVYGNPAWPTLIAYIKRDPQGGEEERMCESADVHLISAAPELYAALKAAEWAAESCGAMECPACCATQTSGQHFEGCSLAATLAKAEGRQV
jgi:hypothetical protein